MRGIVVILPSTTYSLSFLFLGALLAGCADDGGTPFSYTYSISTSYQRTEGADRDPPGMKAGDPARNVDLDIVLLDKRYYPGFVVEICSTDMPKCEPVEDSSHPTGDLEKGSIEPATPIRSGDTIRIPRGEDHAHFRLKLGQDGKGSITVAGTQRTGVNLSPQGLGATVEGCQYEYIDGYPPTSFVAEESKSVTVLFHIICRSDLTH